MPIKAGQQLLHYRLVEKIGEGGMGVVWKAVDTSLDREVAIKVLPPAFTGDPDRLARFEREAKLLAAFNHQGIAGIYGLHTEGGAPFLAMEFIPGNDLAALVRTAGALPLEQVLDVGRQIAEALEAAHQNGIVHRDLKPANVMLTPEGHVKVLDFGLAKAVEAEQVSGHPSMSPTLTSAGTVAGVILGTAGYMSPEQARGRVADKRSDLWALGCVLFEMLTGAKAFSGDTVSDTLASVLKTEPDWQRLPTDTPQALRRLLRRCLNKDAAQRLHDAADARLELNDAAVAPPEEAHDTTTTPRPSRPLLLLGVAALALMAGVVGGLLGGRTLTPSSPEPPVRRFSIPIEMAAGLDGDEPGDADYVPMISPDGARIAWTGNGSVYLRRLDQPDVRPIAGLPSVHQVFWSPDGTQLGVVAAGELWRVGIDGGRPELISDTPGNVTDAAWSPDGTIAMIVGLKEIYLVPAQGGDVVRLADRESAGVGGYYGVTAAPGRGFVVSRGDRLELLDGDTRVELLTVQQGFVAFPNYVDPGYLLYIHARDSLALWALPIEPGATAAAGDPFLMLPGLQMGTAAADGTLVYVDRRGTGLKEIVWATMDGDVESVHGEQRKEIRDVRPSPDGKTIAFVASDGEQRDLWLVDVSTGVETQLTFSEEDTGAPCWSPDGTTLYYSDEGRLFSIKADGTGSPWPLGDGHTPQVSQDGTTLVFSRLDEATGHDIYRRTLAGPDPDVGVGDEAAQVVLNGAAHERRPALSPDGRWLAYVSDEAGERMIWVTRFPSGEGRWQLSSEGGELPQWSSDGNAVYSEWSRRLFKVEVVPRGNDLSVSQSRIVHDGNRHGLHSWHGYHVSADGTRVLTVREVVDEDADPSRSAFHVVENWLRAFRR